MNRINRQVYSRTYKLKHSIDKVDTDKKQNFDQAFQAMLDPMVPNIQPDDIISISMNHSNLSRGELFISHRKWKNMNYSDLFETLATVTQSSNSFLLDGNLTMKVAVISANNTL